MLDPAVLVLVQHLANPPPAIVQPATLTDTEPSLSLYEAIVDEQDRAFAEWLARDEEMRRRTREAIEADPHAFSPQLFDDIIGPFDTEMRRQKKILARLERAGPGGISPKMSALRERALARQHRQYETAVDLVQFLCALRGDIAGAHPGDAPETAWTPNETTVAAMSRARAGHLEVVTIDELRAAILADD